MKAVLDTNIWLDWLVFDDPGVAPLVRRAQAGRLLLVGTARMRDEWQDVIARERFGLNAAARALALERYDAHLRLCPAAPLCTLSCRDPDDQMFIDLAVAESAQWLVTKDKALLALARHAARRHGLMIARPDAPALRAALNDDIGEPL
ncbi:MAG: putative toxin-antitoxin system toxin component, PIN family [Burkholderiales bacterium]|nr:putative toxin-antitoxin system toxin component, PIN family [Burkholderiales bacterium]ODU61970.1 MAG: putative toxin-antitoxin system toxin component, PIN family [Lautropia sp. SCN 66-9]